MLRNLTLIYKEILRKFYVKLRKFMLFYYGQFLA
jgi:hypothetical protein